MWHESIQQAMDLYRIASRETYNNFFFEKMNIERAQTSFLIVERALYVTMVLDFIDDSANPRFSVKPGLLLNTYIQETGGGYDVVDKDLFEFVDFFDRNPNGCRDNEFVIGKLIRGAEDLLGKTMSFSYHDIAFENPESTGTLTYAFQDGSV